MLRFPPPAQTMTRQAMLDHVRALAPRFAERAAAAEAARQIPDASVQDMLAAGLARFLVPPRFGGYGLDFETWFDVVLAISRFDCSHGWCASLMIHHAQLIGCYPEEAQQAVWQHGPDVAIAASFAPAIQVERVDGGYRVSGNNSAFASGVNHSSWVILGGLAPGDGAPEMMLFLVPPGGYTVRDTWFVTGMCATGSNTIVTDNVFVPQTHALSLDALRTGKTPGGARNADPIFRTPFFHYAPLTFAAPMLGAAKGAYEHFRDWTKDAQGPRRHRDGGEIERPGAHGPRRRRPRRRRAAAPPHHADAACARRAHTGRARPLGARFRPRVGTRGRGDRRHHRVVRHGGLRHRASDPARLEGYSPRLHAHRTQPGVQLRAFRPDRAWARARSEPAVFLSGP